MSYPKTFLSRRLRRAFMILLMSIFVIAAPLFVLYASGIRYDFENGRIGETGVLTVNVAPEEADVTFNGITHKDKMPYLFAYQQPGTYTLKIEENGYYPWEKTVDIRRGETTYVHEFFLFKKEKPKQITLSGYTVISGIPSPRGTGMFLILSNGNMQRAAVYDTDRRKLHMLTIPVDTMTHVSWSPLTNGLVIVNTKATGVAVTYIEEIGDNQPTAIDVPEKNARPIWSQKKWGHQPYLVTDTEILALTTTGYESVIKVTQPIAYYNDADDQLIEYNAETGVMLLTENKKTLRIDLQNNPSITEIIAGHKNGVIAKTKKETLVLTIADAQTTIETLSGTNVLFQDAKNRWLVFSETELWTIEDTGKTALVNTSGDGATGIQPLSDEVELFLLSTPQALIGLNTSYATRQTLFESTKIDAVLVNRKKQTMYFIATMNSMLGFYSLEY